jgi:hypothetical protein
MIERSERKQINETRIEIRTESRNTIHTLQASWA